MLCGGWLFGDLCHYQEWVAVDIAHPGAVEMVFQHSSRALPFSTLVSSHVLFPLPGVPFLPLSLW